MHPSRTLDVPECVRRGSVLDDPASRSHDADYYLTDIANGADGPDPLGQCEIWVEADVPVALLGGPERWRANDDDEEREREDHIRSWARAHAGWRAALEESPPLYLHWPGGRWELVDGWHRIRLAHTEGGLDVVPMLVGLMPDRFPDYAAWERWSKEEGALALE